MPSHDSKKKKNHRPQPQQPKPQQPRPQQPGQQQPKPQAPAQAPVKPRDLVDPGVTRDEKTKAPEPYAYKKNDRGAQLFGPDGVKAGDVRQGYIGDCYLAAAMASVAAAKPDAIRQAMKDNKDGTFTVRFYELDYSGRKTVHSETVDGDLPHYNDMPAYAKSTEKVDGKEYMEMWPSIFEKAYAQWKGSYEEMGHGGISGDVMTALTGERSSQVSTAGPGEADALWTKMKAASDQKKPMTAGTGGEEDARYKDPKAGVYGWHAYTVLGVEEAKEGDKTKRYVMCRNPWAKRRRNSDAAAVGDTTNDTAGGVFKLEWAEFRRLYDNVTVNG
ncbi:MAG: hypothetical protein HY902_17465 [Deltaproteobacteria bacterium]|nr:hypothetical protein [Deltaproteobacteria bacterium]